MAKAVSKEIEALSPEVTPITLSTGMEVNVVRMRLRQLMRFMKIITAGANGVLGELSLRADMEPEEFTGQLLGLLLVAIPEAEDEAVEFIKSMVEPVGLIERPRTKDERQKNDDLLVDLYGSLGNPTIDDTFNIIERIVRNEAADIQSLGKRLVAMLAQSGALKAVASSDSTSEASTPTDS
jgi:hypothetical protein